jgi:hypothetical protein
MISPELTLTTDTEELVLADHELEVELPTLPLKLISDQQAFEKKVQELRKEYDLLKPVGIFF